MNHPQITEIHYTPIRPREGLLGFVQFVLNHSFTVGGVGVHTRPNGEGIRLLYPTKCLPNGLTLSLFHPITKDAGEVIEKAVWEKLKLIIQKCGADALA